MHTPGPWTAFQREQESGSNYWRILLHGHPDKQNIHGQDSLAGYCGSENARLIAAAPELLEACKAVLAGYDNPDRDGEFDWVAAADMLRAAIAKAEGKPCEQ